MKIMQKWFCQKIMMTIIQAEGKTLSKIFAIASFFSYPIVEFKKNSSL